MRKPSFWVSLLGLAVVAVNAHGQSYAIKLKLNPDPGQSVTVRHSTKDTGSLKFFDLKDNLVPTDKGAVSETVYAETILEKGDPYPAKYKRVYETATEAKGEEKAKPLSYQGRTVVFELKDGKYRVGVVGTPALETTDRDQLTRRADERSEQSVLLRHLAPKDAVEVGDSWKLDLKKIAAETKPAQIVADKSTAEAKLVKVYTKDKKQFGVFEVKAQLLIEGVADLMRFESPMTEKLDLTVDAAIDGTTTLYTVSGTQKVTGASKVYQGKEHVGKVESDWTTTDREERSAEKDDPKGREVPVVEFPGGNGEWKEFTSKEGKFSANFPDTPQVDTKKDAKGIATTSAVATVEKGTIAYFVTYSDIGADPTKVDPKTILEAIAKSFEAGTKSKKEIALNGFPGLEIVREFEQGGTKLYMKTHLYIVKERLYQVFVIADQSVKDKVNADKLLDSFRLSEKAEEKKEPGK